LLLFRQGLKKDSVWRSKLSFPIHLHFLRYIISQIISPIFPEKRMEVVYQFLQLTIPKEKRTHEVYKKVANIRAAISGDDPTIKKTMYNTLKGIYTFSGNESLLQISKHPIIVTAAYKKVFEGNFPGNPTATLAAGNSKLFSDKRGQIPLNQVYPGNGISGKSFRKLFSAKGEILNLNQKPSKGTTIGNALPDENDVFESTSALKPIFLSRLKVKPNSHLIVPSDSAFNSGYALERSPGKEFNPRASGKELVFNSAADVMQDLEWEVERIKKGLSQAEKTILSNYSSINSKVEEELKKRFEIDRISEQVIQKIAMRLRIEKERRGLL
jgi:hypothetical protein